MITYEKAEFTAAYRHPAIHPQTGICLVNYKGPEFPGTLEGTEPPINCILHYHPLNQRPQAEIRADRILAKYPITAADKVVVFGAGFGWLAEALIAKTGCMAVGVDLSQYVQDNINSSADDELIEAIEAGGLVHTEGHGQIIFDMFSDPAPRCSTVVVQGDIQATKTRNTIKSHLDNKNPNIVITEEVWQTLTAQEQSDYTGALNSWVGVNTGGLVIHVIDGVVI